MAEPDAGSHPAGRASGLRDARPAGLSVRVKLTLSYALFVVIVGVAVFALGFLLLRFVPEGNLYADSGAFAPRRTDLVEVFVRYATWTLLGLAVVGLGGGWIVAGVMLRPLRRITDAARAARDGAFDHRVALPGRRDELTDLADTFDGMLARVTETLDEQRRFAANASHELRTPHATMRTMLEVARSDPAGADVPRLLQRLDDTNERAIRLTEALLALARASRGGAIERRPVDVDAVVTELVAELSGELTGESAVETPIGASALVAPGVRILRDRVVTVAVTAGDEILIRQAVGNLLRNALLYNVPDGWVRVSVHVDGRHVIVDILNTGPLLDAATVATLPEPFVRAAARQRGRGDGTGLGLAIVASIVRAHAGRLELWPRDGGGLHARLRLPRT
ncbi:sensor histidine kinase [Microbacterium sp. LMI1-1-1.1]|uniref:sensor histidine kinase n=1 Tax=Microbacterium sp. LMI1-1-1.1 TaxID=3135223 RepID=UPI003467D583